MEDGIYVEMFAVKNNVRYNYKIVPLKQVSGELVNAVMDGVENIFVLKAFPQNRQEEQIEARA